MSSRPTKDPGFSREPESSQEDSGSIPAQAVEGIDAGENVAVETVLSSDKYQPIVRHARDAIKSE